jgi:hypothetical protein
MGLLNKVISKDPLELDEPGKALRDRILNQSRSTPQAALTMLKAYGSFPIGICLALRGDRYESYAIAGIGVGKVAVSQRKINIPPGGKGKIGTTNMLAPGVSHGNAEVWAFALDDQNPCGFLLLLAADPKGNFNPEAIEGILDETRQHFIPAGGEAGFSPPKEHLRDGISRYARSYPRFQGILLKIPVMMDEDGLEGFVTQVEAMTASFGQLIRAPMPWTLILFPPSLDRELISHRITKTLKTLAPLNFEADSSDKALSLLRPYL